MSADLDMFYRPEPESAFDAVERLMWEAQFDIEDDYVPGDEEDLLDPTGGWCGWEDQPEWI